MNPRKLVKKATAAQRDAKNPAFVAAVKLHNELREQGVLFALDIEEDGNLIFKTNGPVTEEQGKTLESTDAADMFAAIFQYACDNGRMMMLSPALVRHLLLQTPLDLV